MELKLRNIIIEGDSLLVINALRMGKFQNWKLNTLLKVTLSQLNNSENFKINHTLREGNQEADSLSNLGADGVSLKEVCTDNLEAG